MKPTLLLLHGALGAASQMEPLKGQLSARYDVHSLDFSGHGHSDASDGPFRISLFVEDVLRYMEANQLDRASFFGYSMGGYVALALAKAHPEKVGRILTLATKLHWDEATAARETAMLDVGKIAAKVPQLAQLLAERHVGKDWQQVVGKTAAMLLEMGAEPPLKEADLSALAIPVTLLLGDRDKMVGIEETLAASRLLPQGAMGMLPGTPHPFEQVDTAMVAFFVDRMMADGRP